jgi:hypothetical protein
MRVDCPAPEGREGPASSTQHGQGRAERVLGEYLRQWGLRDPFVIAAFCQAWVRRVTESQGSGPGSDLARATLEAAAHDVDAWLDHLARLVAADPTEAAARRGPLAMEVAAVIDHYPQAFLEYDSLPEPLLQHLREAARPVVPAAAEPTRMQGPPLGKLPPLLQPKHWRRFFSRLKTPLVNALARRRDRSS